MVKQEWPLIKKDLDNHQLAPLGLVLQKSSSPLDLRHCHQILTYGYEVQGTEFTLLLYDPNHPNRDDVTMSLNLADPFEPVPVTYSTGETILCFFHNHYQKTTKPLPV